MSSRRRASGPAGRARGSSRPAAAAGRRKGGAKPRRGARTGPRGTVRLRWWRQLRRAPGGLRLSMLLLVTLALAAAANVLYQVARKPTELFYPVSAVLSKSPQQTWAGYGSLFRRYATANISAETLAALAQVEAAGNPLVRTYWRWSWVTRPFEMYRPASSAVGMYQMTDGNFAAARHYCIREHRAVRDDAAAGGVSCGFLRPYLRVLPADAIEMTAAFLDVQVTQILAHSRLRHTTAAQRARLAAVVHLCGAGAGAVYAHRGLSFAPGQRCGDHDPALYVGRVEAMRAQFAHLAARDPQ